MKKFSWFLGILSLLLFFTSCSTKMKTVKPVKVEKYSIDYGVREQGRQTVALALEYYNQGGFQKSGDLFLEAADLYKKANAVDEEKKALIAAAKIQLKSNNRQKFILSMTRFKDLLRKLEMPSEEERLLINLASHIKGIKELPYPVMAKWQEIFN